ncbi:DUF1553 domain-containing protein [Arenibacter sp. N53]|uniref:DUF1553 domain-containing protein n=1 Tax=Arenibacter TaxID=178469 RepID=UPI000CD3F6A7|nr:MULTISPECIES: DUF1553 domain-containing protein [Arenibacter]MCM4152083.1 DUF1553 domain-containing protein [Arenibacter sp. N53]
MKFYRIYVIIGITVLFNSCGWNAPAEVELALQQTPDIIDFNYHVKPILSDKCFSCHGPDTDNQKSDLRLDNEESALSAHGDSKTFAIVPGKPGASDLIKRILSDNLSEKMPPPESNLSLSNKEIAILAKWIEQGAEYKPHWSFIKPSSPELPRIQDSNWAKNELDYFVFERLEKEKLEPSIRASKESLIRRLSFNLTGLPPSLVEMNAFVADTSADAYEKLVDRLLSSPAYGERMAADWMDVARYADSDGYLDDKHRDFSPYRDWVIKSFNENMPYDEFTTLQLAGDLIPEPTKESVLATAFNRLHKRNSEAGIIFEEYRVEYVADRVLSVGKAFMGLSMECARCHDHKYDPISQKNYYEMAAFFNNTNEFGSAVYGPAQVPGPSLLLTDKEADKVLEFIDNDIVKAEDDLKSLQVSVPENFQNWSSSPSAIRKSVENGYSGSLIAYYPFDSFLEKGNKKYVSPNKVDNSQAAVINEPIFKKGAMNNGVFLNDFTSISLPGKMGWFDQTDPFTISLSVYPDTQYDDAALFYHCEDLRLGLKGYSMFLENNQPKFIMAFSWPTNAIQIKAKQQIPEKEWTNIAVTYDGLGKAGGIHMYLNGKEIPVEVEIDHLYKSILFQPNLHTYGFNGFGMGIRNHMKTFINGGMDELKIHNAELSALEVAYSFDASIPDEMFKNPATSINLPILLAHYELRENGNLKDVKESIRGFNREKNQVLDTIQEIMVMGDLPKPRSTYLLERGAYDARGEEVFPGVPEEVLPFSDTLPRNRLGLAMWLFDKENPVTARVFMNRLWQMHFGSGLVYSSDDFGNQGGLPSHPKLLDWLAVEFMESGWDVKAMHKLIVMSATYQQSSMLTPKLEERDKENILLARGPSFRMTAEMIRDNALAISGLLYSKIGGPSVYPYQPEGLWDEISNKPWRYKYLQEPGEGLYRRSLYTIWKRTSGPPSMLIFDVGERGVCTVKRRQTSTPLQALVLLNDPQFLEASRVVAENLISDYGGDVDLQLQKAFVLCTGRNPNKTELGVLSEFHKQELERFSKTTEDALAYVSIGSSEVKHNTDPVKLAALATVVNGVMNTFEGYTIR